MSSRVHRLKNFADFEQIRKAIQTKKHIANTTNSDCYVAALGGRRFRTCQQGNQHLENNVLVFKKYKPHVSGDSVIREYNMLTCANVLNKRFMFFPKPFGIYNRQRVYYLAYQYIYGVDGFAYDLQLDHGTKSILMYIKTLLLMTRSLHLKNITHLDIKPVNFIYNDNKYLSFLDFGTARWLMHPQERKLTKTTVQLGTAYFAAPEAVERQYNCTTDVYSIGKIFQDQLVSQNNLDPQCQEICAKMLHNDPSVRPSIKDILNDKLFSTINRESLLQV